MDASEREEVPPIGPLLKAIGMFGNLDFECGGRPAMDVLGEAIAWVDIDLPEILTTLTERVSALEAEKEQLRAFARDVLRGFWEKEGGDDLQDFGVKHGLLIPTVMQERCGESCSCAEYGADFPATCYRYAPILKIALRADTDVGAEGVV